nr:CapA family protein [Clostridia bacterium]
MLVYLSRSQAQRRAVKSVLMAVFSVLIVCSALIHHIAAHMEEPAYTAVSKPRAVLDGILRTDTTYPADVETMTFSFVGDCMLASMLGQMSFNSFNLFASETPKEYFFSQVQSVFASDDYTVANCENVFTDRNLYAARKNYSPAYW